MIAPTISTANGRESVIRSSLARVEEKQHTLSHFLDELAGRLSPVLPAPTPPDGPAGRGPEPVRSELAMRLDGVVESQDRAILKLRHLLDQLEV